MTRRHLSGGIFGWLSIEGARHGTISGFVDWLGSGGTAKSAVVLRAVRCNARAAFLMMRRSKLFSVRPPVEGMAMTMQVRPSRRFWLLPVVMIAGFSAWAMLPGSSGAESQSVAAPSPVIRSAQDTLNPAITATEATPATPATPAQATPPVVAPVSVVATAPEEATVAVEAAPVEGLKISSQSWRRGGLGSKALVTLTLRNGNDYPVKDIAITCAFARRDGTHLTDRTRVIHDTVNTRGRRTFARMHVGFVNINAAKAKCALVAASRI
jgi:hypothetical protein